MDEVEKFHNEPMQTLMFPKINAEFKLYTKMQMSILNTEDEVGFITSDNPCVWFDCEAYKRPPAYRAVGLGYKSIEVTLPISPKQVIIISHVPLPLYVSVPMKTVDSINRKTRFYADKHYVVNKNFKNDLWFKVIEPPNIDN